MDAYNRLSALWNYFDDLSDTTSILEKHAIIDTIPSELKEDLEVILRVLKGDIKLGYKYETYDYMLSAIVSKQKDFGTVKELIQYLCEPRTEGNLSRDNIIAHCMCTAKYAYYIEPIVNRTLKLGIGASLLEKEDTSPMLAKKYLGDTLNAKKGLYVTEKLDGNRCIAKYNWETNKWEFKSRNGKNMRVSFNMDGLPKNCIFDGEVLSDEQVRRSNNIYNYVQHNVLSDKKSALETTADFSNTSGIINRIDKGGYKLVYNIFDVVDDQPYSLRRAFIDSLRPEGNDVRILPILLKLDELVDQQPTLFEALNKVTTLGGEGLMINLGGAGYLQKRTDQLLKLKKCYSMDMKVISLEDGRGKYEGLVGALSCYAKSEDGKYIQCSVGTGLSDEQRANWSIHPEEIVGKIIEVEYFSISSNKDSAYTNIYSLRFPRFKKVRDDKVSTSID